MGKKIKAIALLSGGLDSVLSVALIKKQDIEVTGLLIRTGFTDHKIGGEGSITEIAEALGIPLRIEDIRDEYWDTLFYPKYGYGKHMNPCLDCHIHMIHVAAGVMQEEEADFVISGEVIGQRPKSQLAHQMKIACRDSGIEGRLLRPLSAKRLKPTIPEKEGSVDRSKLKGFHGRGRTPQLRLAKELGVEDLAVAAGGNCFLTNKEFSERFRDLLDIYGKADFPKEDIPLLRIGRHFRLSGKARLIISRDESEYHLLRPYQSGRYAFELRDVIGAIAVGTGTFSREDMVLAAGLLGRYSKAEDGQKIRVCVKYKDKEYDILTSALSVADPLIARLRI